MEVYPVFKTDASGSMNSDSGTYILLSGNHVVNEINMPKVCKGYYNKKINT
jgi:hypothetical protein